MLPQMQKILCLFALLTVTSVSAQEKESAPCTVPADARQNVDRYLDRALIASKKVERDFPRSNLIAAIAMGKVCLQDFSAAAQLADLAYPSGSKPADELGLAVAAAGRLKDIPALESQMSHGTDSFLAGVATGLAHAGRFAEADQWAAKIPSPEVRADVQEGFTTELYKAGKSEEAKTRAAALLEKADAKVKEHASTAEFELDMSIESGNWTGAHHALDQMPDSMEKRYAETMMAVAEAEQSAPDAEKDLQSAAQNFRSRNDPPFEGYLIAAHLAGLGNLSAAMRAAETVRDDEWNRKCWTTIALFQAEAGKLAEARASIAKIGTGNLEHALGDAPEGRDMARAFVAQGLAEGGHGDAALSLLADREDKESYTDRYFLPARIEALAATGDLASARSIVEKELADAVVIDEETDGIAEELVTAWSLKDRDAAETWITAQKQPETQAACWSALALAAMGQKQPVTHYFVNWD
jgi:hypothetical protein